ncbi:copper resistance CopC family protein [Priestia aryabhattai]|uniref:copper resistance CopC family protein n=1 Tax=Priestia TaxID=2800373 RepID=UPI001E39D3D5|nr:MULTISPECIES: copper resistance CopC family protein [Priestia]MCE4093136.1 copper resistance protein CopC [Priestia megaterium]MED3821825.1 copper resistance protein CopC [Priestia aryabhattai]
MKKFLFSLILSLLLLPTIASAHTGLVSSTPSKGEVVKEDLNEISTVFKSKIETLSTMKLMKDNKEVPFAQIKVIESKMVGKISAPLENGSYQLEWKIVGEDGHPITGAIPFSVKKAKSEEGTDSSLTEPKASSKEKSKELEKQSDAQKSKNEETSSTPSLSLIIIMIGLVLIIVVFLFVFLKKKNK